MAYIHRFRTWVSSAGFKKYLANTGWLFSVRVVGMAFSFFVTAYVARYLGPENYGFLSYAISFIGIFSFVSTLGIDQVIYRDLIKFPELKDKYMGSALLLKILAGAAATALVIIFGYVFPQNDVSSLLILILSFTFILNSFSVVSYEFQARVESKYPAITGIAVVVVLNILKILVVLMNKGVIYLALVLLLEPLLTSIMLVVYRVKKIGGIGGWRVDKRISLSLLRDSLPLMLSSAFALIYGRIDQVFIKHLIDTKSVGLYDAAVRLSEVWYLIPNVLVSSLFPAIVNAKSISEEEYARRLSRLGLLLTGAAIAVSIPFALFAPLIMRLVFGAAFVAGAGVLQIYIWSNIGTFLGSLSTNYLVNENMRFVVLFSSCTGMIANIVLNLILIPRLGINGSAIATLISYSLVPLSLLLFKKPRHMVYTIFNIKHVS